MTRPQTLPPRTAAGVAAKAAGLNRYLTGKPCRHGHLAERYACSGICVECATVKRHAQPDRYKQYWRDSYKRNRVKRIKEQTDYRKQLRHEAPWIGLIAKARCRARVKGVLFSLTYDWGQAHWSGRCALTGLEFDLNHGASHGQPFSPSIDRIVPSLGYVPENCRFVLFAFNAFRGAMTDAELLKVASAFVKMAQNT